MDTPGIIDREHEADVLRELADRGRPALALVRGRRRVGKTYLLSQLWDPRRALYFVASATAPEINRRMLVQTAASWAGVDLRPEDHPTWRLVFRSLLALRPDEPIVIILDEFQYLAAGEDGLREVASELNAVWESEIQRTAGVLVVLCGSAVRTLEALEQGGSPLYGRLDATLGLAPFDYYDSAQMLRGYSMRDCIDLYAALGGLPANLAEVDAASDAAQNIVRLALAPDGIVRTRIRTQLDQEEGLRQTQQYRAVLASIGFGARTVGEIASKMGRRVDSALKRLVAQLEDLSYLRSELDFGESRTRGLRYRLADPAARFHYRIALPMESAAVAFGPQHVWDTQIRPEIFPTYVGWHVFEDVARQAYVRWAVETGLPLVPHWQRWQGTDRTGAAVDIDMVGRTLDGGLVTGSVKYRGRQATARTYLDHEEALRRLAASGRSWAYEALQPSSPFFFLSSGGFAASFGEACEPEREVITWTLRDIFRPEHQATKP